MARALAVILLVVAMMGEASKTTKADCTIPIEQMSEFLRLLVSWYDFQRILILDTDT